MAVFVDAARQRWMLNVTPQKLRQVRKEYGLDLTVRDSARALARDPALLVNVLAELLSAEIAARGLSAVDFAKCMARGSTIDEAVIALISELEKVVA